MELENTQNESGESEITSLADIQKLNEGYSKESSSDEPSEPVVEAKEKATPEAKAPVVEPTGEANADKEVIEPKVEAATEYKPDYSYKTPSGKKELPEAVRPLIKTKEDESYWRDIFSAADGLPKIREEGMKWQKSYEELAAPAQAFIENVEMGNLAQAFEAAGVPKPSLQQIITGFGYSPEDIGREVVRLMDLTPEQQSLESKAQQAELRANRLEQTVSQFELDRRTAATSELSNRIESVLSQNTIAPLVAEFDRRNGPNAFKLEIASHGERVFEEHGVVLPPEELAQHVIKRYGLDALVAKQEEARNAPQQTQQVNKPQRAQALPVIPAVGEGSTGSPAEQSFNSLSDLKRYYQNQYGQA